MRALRASAVRATNGSGLYSTVYKSGNRKGKRRWADATISKMVKHAKQFFDAVVRKELIDRNPFSQLKSTGKDNPENSRFIERATNERVLKQVPENQWELIIAVWRYGVMRCPSENLQLKWTDVDFEKNRIRVSSSKTKRHKKGFRIMPLFPELLPYLRHGHELEAPGTSHVITRYRDSRSNLRTQMTLPFGSRSSVNG